MRSLNVVVSISHNFTCYALGDWPVTDHSEYSLLLLTFTLPSAAALGGKSSSNAKFT